MLRVLRRKQPKQVSKQVSKGETDNDGCVPTGTSDKLGVLGGSKGGTDCDSYEKEKVGMA